MKGENGNDQLKLYESDQVKSDSIKMEGKMKSKKGILILFASAMLLSANTVFAESVSENEISSVEKELNQQLIVKDEDEILSEQTVKGDNSSTKPTWEDKTILSRKIDGFQIDIHGHVYPNGNIDNKYAVIESYEDIGVIDIVIPEKIGEIPVTQINCTFTHVNGLKSITIPGGVETVGNIIGDTEEKISIVLLNGVKTIDASAFLGCTGLVNITIPESVTNIGDSAFFGCTGLTTVTLPANVVKVGESAFGGCKNLQTVKLLGGIEKMGQSVFSGCFSLTAVEISEGVKSLGYAVFDGCNNLKSITIPGSMTKIADGAFISNKGLVSVTMKEGVQAIGQDAFLGCKNLATVVMPVGLTTIGSSAFESCTALTSVTIPQTVTDIGAHAYLDCSNLENLILSEGVVNIGEGAFEECAITSLVIPKSVKSIGKSAFSSCNIKTLILPYSVTNIGSEAFVENNDMMNIYYSGTKEQWSQIKGKINIFSSSDSYKVYYNSNGPGSIPSVGASITDSVGREYRVIKSDEKQEVALIKLSIKDEKKKSMKLSSSVTIDGTVYRITEIGANAFKNNKVIQRVVVPGSIRKIGNSCFEGCRSLKSITIGTGTTTIGKKAFKKCSALKKVVIKSKKINAIGNRAFSGIYSKCTVKVPKNKLKTYRTLLKGKGLKKTNKIVS